MAGIGDMSRRSKRLQEKGATQDADEGKTENRRLSAGGVLGLDAPAGTPNLRTALAVSAAAAAAATLDAYNAEGQDDDGENTNDEEKEGGDARAEAIAEIIAPSDNPEMRRASMDLMYQTTASLMASGMKGKGAEAPKSNDKKKKKKKKKRKKGDEKQWYGIAKGLWVGHKYCRFSEMKHLVHGVKPALYEAFPTEALAKDFVANHRDHHEGAKQKSARKARNAEWEARHKAGEE